MLRISVLSATHAGTIHINTVQNNLGGLFFRIKWQKSQKNSQKAKIKEK